MSNNKSKWKKMGRRAFMISGSLVGGGILVGVGGLTYVNHRIKQYSEIGLGEGSSLNAWIRIRPDNQITLSIPRAEMGQGVYTSLSMLLAEELEVGLDQIEVVHPEILASPYTNVTVANGQRDVHSSWPNLKEKVAYLLPYVGTGGSTSIRDAYDHHRIMGAAAREMLCKAAAKKWSTDIANCKAEGGFIIHQKTKAKLSYADLAADAAQETPPSNPTLKASKDFKLINKSLPRLDIPDKVTGKAKFGIDIRLDGMLFAAIRHCPIMGGKITGVKNKAKILKLKGVKKVLELPSGVAVVADNTWRAKQASLQLDLEVDAQGNDKVSTESLRKNLETALASEPQVMAEQEGQAGAKLKSSSKVLSAEYAVPYLAHACMEPLNCTVKVEGNKADVWVGHQAPVIISWALKEGANISSDNIKMHIQYLGGGFGRRAEKDFVVQAAQIAKEMPGTPVQLVWTREEATRNDKYRPQALSQFKACLDAKGKIEAWENRIAIQSVPIEMMERNAPSLAPGPSGDESSAEGAVELPYAIPHRAIAFNLTQSPVPVGSWRSVGHSQNAFFTECFFDEVANEAGKDPLKFRLELFSQESERYRKVLEKVRSLSNWDKKLPEGKARGVAIHRSFGSIVAEVVEISKVKDKQIKVDKVYAVIDCGKTVNPDTIEAQIQSGIVYGLSAAYFGEITLKDGKVQESNFPQYPVVTLKNMPEVEVAIMENTEEPGGVGEPGTPPIAPALCNAIFALNGERVRKLPLKSLGYSFNA